MIQKALILVAGLGTRLKPLTTELPKCLAEVNGISILMNNLIHLWANGFQEVVVVTGYKDLLIQNRIGNQFKTMNIQYIRNPLYHLTNNMYSLWLARHHLTDSDGVMLIEGDLFFEPAVLERVMNTDQNSCWAVDRFSLYREGCMLTCTQTGEIEKIEIIRKPLQAYQSNHYKSAGILKITRDMGQIFSSCLDFEVRHWNVNFYYDEVLARHLHEFDLKICSVSDLKWVEIDDIKDLKKAEALFYHPNQSDPLKKRILAKTGAKG